MKKIIMLLMILLLAGCHRTGDIEPELIKKCPDAWIEDKMPCACITENCEGCKSGITEYYIINNERKETWEVDKEWIKQNCKLEKTIVV